MSCPILNLAMEVRTIAVMAELAINVDTIEYKSSSIHGNSFELPFSISVDGSNYHGTIVLNKKYLFCYVYDVKSLTGNVSMMISKGKIISKCSSSVRKRSLSSALLLSKTFLPVLDLVFTTQTALYSYPPLPQFKLIGFFRS